MSDEFEGLTTGLSNIAANVDKVAVNLGTAKESVDGVTETLKKSKLDELSEEVLKLPPFIQNMLKELGVVSDHAKKIVEILDADNESDDELSAAAEEAINKTGTKDGWTADKVASKVPVAFAAPALFLGSRLDTLLGEKSVISTCLTGIRDLLANNLTPKTTKNKKETQNKDETSGPKASFGMSLKDTISANKTVIAAAGLAAAMNDLIKVAALVNISNKGGVLTKFGKAIEKVKNIYYVNPDTRELRFTAKDVAATKSVEKIFSTLKDTMKTLIQGMALSMATGLLALPASAGLLATTAFLKSVKVFLSQFGTAKETEEFAVRAQWVTTLAWNIKTSFKHLALAMPFILMAGILALPATVALIPIRLFFRLLKPMLASIATMELELAQAIPVCISTVVFAVSMFAAIKALSKITLKDTGLAIVGVLGSTVVMGLLAALGIAADKALKPMTALLLTSFTAAGAVIGLTFLVISLKGLNRVMQEYTGASGFAMVEGVAKAFLPTLMIFTMFTALGVIASVVQPLIVSFTACVWLSVAAIIGTSVLVKALKSSNEVILGLYKETKQNPLTGQLEEVQGSPVAGMFGAALRFMALMAPIAMIMVAVAAVGLIGIVATIGAVGLTLFTMLSISAFERLPKVLTAISTCVSECSKVFADAGKDSLFGKLADGIESLAAKVNIDTNLDGLRAVGGFLRIMGSMAAIGGVILMSAIVGIVGTVAMPFMIGLTKFAEHGVPAFGSLPTIISSIGTAVDSASVLFGQAAGVNDYGDSWLSKIPFLNGMVETFGALKMMGGLFKLSMVIVSCGLLGMVCTKAASSLDALATLAPKLSEGAGALSSALPSIKLLTTKGKEVFEANKDGKWLIFGKSGTDAIESIIKDLGGVGDKLQKNATKIGYLSTYATQFNAGVTGLKSSIDALGSLGDASSTEAKRAGNAITSFMIDPLMRLGEKNGPITLVGKLREGIDNVRTSVNTLVYSEAWKSLTEMIQSGNGSVIKIDASSKTTSSSTSTESQSIEPALDNVSLAQLAKDVAEIKRLLSKDTSWATS